MRENNTPEQNFFQKWFLNNRFSIILLNLLLFFVTIFVFNSVSFVLNPVWAFFDAIFPPLLLATIQYYLMNPIVDFLERKAKFPRTLTIITLFVMIVLLLVWAINSLMPIVQRQVTGLINHWPEISKTTQQNISNLISDPKMAPLRKTVNEWITNLQNVLQSFGSDHVADAASGIGSAVNILTMTIMTLLTAPFILFFMLKDGHQIRPFVAKIAPQRWEDSFSALLKEMNEAIAAYVRGQLTVAFWVGIIFLIGYSLISLPYGAAFAIIAAVMNLVPYFGTPLALIPVLIVSAMNSWALLAKVLVVFLIEQTIESRIISPIVVGNKMNMHPVTTILVLIGSGAVFGLWGVIFGIPGYAVLKIIVTRVYNYYRVVSHLYDDQKADLHLEQEQEKEN